MKNYELYLILTPEISSDEAHEKVELITNLLTQDLKATDISIEQEGLRKLAYPIKKHKTGYYTLIHFNIEGDSSKNIVSLEKKLNLNESVLRYLIVNQTEFNKQKQKETLNTSTIRNHRELNKSLSDKKCIVHYIGYRVIDYKDTEFLKQFTSPYAKIFKREKTGVSAKYQRKIKQAIKRARHMALMPFTANHLQ